MTADDWQTCTDPRAMLDAVRGRAGARKLRLFACAVARRLPPPLVAVEGPERAAAIEVAERFADGGADAAELARASACSTGEGFWSVAYPDAFEAAELAVREEQMDGRAAEMADLLRDLLGDPFQPAMIDPAWRSRAVRTLAAAAYDRRDPAAWPGLADALEEAGGTDPAVLAHLRGPGPHVRGCWVVDGLLRKE